MCDGRWLTAVANVNFALVKASQSEHSSFVLFIFKTICLSSCSVWRFPRPMCKNILYARLLTFETKKIL
jgi:hypothetical protein